MILDTNRFNATVEVAKAKAADSPAWLRAIERAAEGILSGELIVTTLAHGALVTSSNGSYMANGSCQCKAFRRGHKECRHRAAARLIELYETADLAVSPADERADIIADIKARWPRDLNLADELMARFRVNSLNFLADDMLAGVLAAIA